MKKVRLQKYIDKNNILIVMSVIWLLAIVVGVSVFLYYNFSLTADDDTGAEMILSNLIAKEGGILSSKWYYSTEIRFLNTQIVYGFLFKFISNWRLVRTLGNGIMLVLLSLAVIYLCYQINLKRYAFIIAGLFIVPISYQYYFFALAGGYLLPHITLSVISLALYLNITRLLCEKREGLRAVYLIVTLALVSFLSGCGGLRHIFIFSVPLTMAIVLYWNKSIEKRNIKKYVYLDMLSVCLSCFGYVVNKHILSKRYMIGGSYNTDAIYSGFSMEALSNTLNGWLESVGYRTGESLLSFSTLYNVIPLILIVSFIFILKNIVKNETKNDMDNPRLLLCLFVTCGALSLTWVFSFTDMIFMTRYLIPISVYFWVVFFIIFDTSKVRNKVKRLISVGLCVMVTFLLVIDLKAWAKIDETFEMRQVSSILMEKGYNEGYTVEYWRCGNAMTEYTNGNIRVWRLKDAEPEDFNSDKDGSVFDKKLFLWLSSSEQLVEKPKGKCFLILPFKVDNFDVADVLYESDELIVYGFDDYINMIQYFHG